MATKDSNTTAPMADSNQTASEIKKLARDIENLPAPEKLLISRLIDALLASKAGGRSDEQ